MATLTLSSSYIKPNVMGEIATDIMEVHAPTRSISFTVTGTQQFNKTVFSPLSGISVPALYAGAKAAGNSQLALARVVLNSSTSPVSVAPSALAPLAVTLNGVANPLSPLFDTEIKSLALYNDTLPTVVSKDPVNGDRLFLVSNQFNGSTLLENVEQIHDAASADIGEIPAVTASADTIFAPVSATGTTWADATAAGLNRGVAVLKPAAAATDGLTVYDATNFAFTGPTNKANPVLLTPGDGTVNKVVAFDAKNAKIATAEMGEAVDAYWDSGLQRLYIGLDAVHRDDATKEGGVLSVFTGRLDPAAPATATSLQLNSIVNLPTKALFYDVGSKNVDNRAIGLYYDGLAGQGQKDARATASKVRVMHTSTNKDYLVVNSRVGAAPAITAQVAALPLLGAKNFDGTKDIDPVQIGTLSKVAAGVPTFNESPTAFAEMPTVDQTAVAVAPGLLDPSFITDMFVEGDTVYVALDGPTNISKGIFQSTAIFNANGSIKAWTPAQRVMGNIERVNGAALDTSTGNYYMLTAATSGAGSPMNTAKITQWGTSTDASLANSKLLSDVVTAIFPQNIGGVQGLFTFDERTPGFVGALGESQFSMMVATGLNKVALIQSGSVVGGAFTPTAQFTTAALGQNVFPFDLTALNLGPITTAEVMRTTAANSGWVFVGGVNGVAVLRKSGAGTVAPRGEGYQSAAPGLSALSGTAGQYPGNGTGANFYSFKALTPAPANSFSQTRKIVTASDPAGGTAELRLYIMTKSTLYVATPTAAKFTDDEISKPATLAETAIVQTGDPVLTPGMTADACLTDFVVIAGRSGDSNFRALLATTKGLFKITGSPAVVTEVLVGGEAGQPILQLQYLSTTKGVPSTTGNLYVLTANASVAPSTGSVYRYAIDGTVAAGNFALPVAMPDDATGQLFDLNQFRSNIYADGTMILNTRGKNFGDTEFLNSAIPEDGANYALTGLIDIDRKVNYNVGAPIRDSASGTLIVPGDWGVRVNE